MSVDPLYNTINPPSRNQMTMSGEAAQPQILVLDAIINQCWANTYTPPHMQPGPIRGEAKNP